jgi:hypothetical protein
MPAPRQRKESIWVTLAWTLNLLGLGGIAFVGIAYVITHPTFFASAQEAQPIPTIGLPNTFTPDRMPCIYRRSPPTRNRP